MNPYQPPIQELRQSQIAPRMRMRFSKLKLDECQNICGSGVLGIVGWLQFRLSMGLLDRQIIPTPGSLADELRDEAEIPKPLLNKLNANTDGFEQSGFHTPLYCASESQGISVTAAALRLMHKSGKFFLVAVAAEVGPVINGDLALVTIAEDERKERTTHITSNGRKRFRPSSRTRVQFNFAARLSLLVNQHIEWLENNPISPVDILTVTDLHDAVDWMTAHHVEYMIERGLYEPLDA